MYTISATFYVEEPDMNNLGTLKEVEKTATFRVSPLKRLSSKHTSLAFKWADLVSSKETTTEQIAKFGVDFFETTIIADSEEDKKLKEQFLLDKIAVTSSLNSHKVRESIEGFFPKRGESEE